MSFISILKKIKIYLFNTYPYRYYFNKYKCIYIHITKVAGTSVLKELSNNKKIYRDHSTWFDFYRFNPIKFNTYFKFTIIRNPFDRAVSVYTYLKNGGNKTDDLYFLTLFKKEDMTFEKFVLEYLDEYKIHEHILFKPQYLFIYDYKYNLKVDYVAKLENIDKDFEYIKSKIHLQGDKLQNSNKSSRKQDYRAYYKNKDVINKIIKLYKKDFNLLKYNMFIEENEKCIS